jgi:hypothetical protein
MQELFYQLQKQYYCASLLYIIFIEIKFIPFNRSSEHCFIIWHSVCCLFVSDLIILPKERKTMSYLAPAEFSTKMVHVGKSKIFMLPRDTVIRTLMTSAFLLLAAVFSITIAVNTGSFLLGAILFPLGLCTLYLMGFGFYW